MNRYNGKTVEQITSNLPINMCESHKTTYITNVVRVIECQTTGYNTNEIESLKNFNFNLISLYLTGKLS